MSRKRARFAPPIPSDQDPENVRNLIAMLSEPANAGGIQPQDAMERFGWNYDTWGWTVHLIRRQYGSHALVTERRDRGPGWYRWAADMPDVKAYVDRRQVDGRRRIEGALRQLNLGEAEFGADRESRAVRIMLQAVVDMMEPAA